MAFKLIALEHLIGKRIAALTDQQPQDQLWVLGFAILGKAGFA